MRHGMDIPLHPRLALCEARIPLNTDNSQDGRKNRHRPWTSIVFKPVEMGSSERDNSFGLLEANALSISKIGHLPFGQWANAQLVGQTNWQLGRYQSRRVSGGGFPLLYSFAHFLGEVIALVTPTMPTRLPLTWSSGASVTASRTPSLCNPEAKVLLRS